MGIKVKSDVRAIQKKEKPFPKLMISNRGLIVLFNDFGQGTVLLRGEGATKLASYSKTFNMSIFTDYEGKLIIEND